MNAKRISLLLTLLTLVMAACTLGANPEQDMTQQELLDAAVATVSAQQLVDAGNVVPLAGSQEEVAPPQVEVTELPTETPLPSPTAFLTATPSEPVVGVTVDTNCRFGPHVGHAYLGAVNTNEKAAVLGRLADNSYTLVENPDLAGTCWLWMSHAFMVSGDLNSVPVVEPPPPPAPTFTPTPEVSYDGQWLVSLGGGGEAPLDFTQNNNLVTITFDFFAETVTMTGALEPDGVTVYGNWNATDGSNGTFAMQIKKNINQFVGNFESGGALFDWCGHRPGANKPSPCLWP
ncbi:MAG: hypothetical protein DWQ07_21570 [Chloroflexi bacterium]|nr:MAG: hypothetical protein DWQ07_21570 [Chloroflexota bacterium]MBL1196588.1 hypothetical protein [Chloroflexota bacterium]